jgi:hypothetical protein
MKTSIDKGQNLSKAKWKRKDPLKQRGYLAISILNKLSKCRNYEIFIPLCLHLQRRLDHAPPLQISFPTYKAHVTGTSLPRQVD